MHGIRLDHPAGKAFAILAEFPGQAHGRDLAQGPLVQQIKKDLLPFQNHLISFGMSDHRHQAAPDHPLDHLV